MNPTRLISVVVPTKYAGPSIRSTVGTVLQQSYSCIELVISDAAHSDELELWVKSLADPRVVYVRPPRGLSFSDDWNFALDSSRGDLVTFLGDDDGLLPNALDFAVNVISEMSLGAITWTKINYNWPDHLVPGQRSLLAGDSSPHLYIVSARRALRLLSKFLLGYARLPCIYNSLVRREYIEVIKAASPSGKFFSGVIPDVYSSIVLAAHLERYAFATFPLSVNGAACHSSGVKQGIPDLDDELKKTIPDVLSCDSRYHPDIGPFSTAIGSIIMGEFLIARQVLGESRFPPPNWRGYLRYLVREARHSPHPGLIGDAARYTRKRRKMIFWIPRFDRHVARVESSAASFKGCIYLDPGSVPDVEHAARLCASLMPSSPDFQNAGARGLILRALHEAWGVFVRAYQLYLMSQKSKRAER